MPPAPIQVVKARGEALPSYADAGHGIHTVVESDDVDDPAVSHRENLPAQGHATAFPCGSGAPDGQGDEEAVTEHLDFGHPAADARFPASAYQDRTCLRLRHAGRGFRRERPR